MDRDQVGDIYPASRIDLESLRRFVVVAEEANFTRAAARLHLVQSAISATIKNLEHELGAPLLDRNSKRVLLTDAGAALLPGARAVLDAAREAAEAVAEVRGGLRGTLRLGTLTSVRLLDLPALLGAFHQQYPGVLLQTTAAPSGTQGLVDGLLERRLDLAFVSWAGPPPAGVTLTGLASSVLDLVVPAGHPLAGRGRVPIDALAGLDFVDSPVRPSPAASPSRSLTSPPAPTSSATAWAWPCCRGSPCWAPRGSPPSRWTTRTWPGRSPSPCPLAARRARRPGR
jgi:DNA-binding transcriptional LysR family regulator